MRTLDDNCNFKREFEKAIDRKEVLVFNYTEMDGLTIILRLLPFRMRKNRGYWMVDGYESGIITPSNLRQIYVSNCGFKGDDIVVASIKSLLPFYLKRGSKDV